MTVTIDQPTTSITPSQSPATGGHGIPTGERQRRWNRLSTAQLLVMALFSIAPLFIAGVYGAALAGFISLEMMTELALAAGENPGMVTFGAMFLASPVQWLTGRSQIRVRKYLGIMFFALALSNGALFVVEAGIGSVLSLPFLIAGTVALLLATPLFLTSSRRAQRALGMRNWRLLHRLTYVVAIALLGHVALIGDAGPGAAMITIGFVARLAPIRRWLQARPAARARSGY